MNSDDGIYGRKGPRPFILYINVDIVKFWHYFFLYYDDIVLLWGKGQNIKNQNVESPKVDRKFEKDQNVKSEIRLSMFWSFLTPYVKSERQKYFWLENEAKHLTFWYYLWRQKRSECWKSFFDFWHSFWCFDFQCSDPLPCYEEHQIKARWQMKSSIPNSNFLKK